jgi:hypothetical protein
LVRSASSVAMRARRLFGWDSIRIVRGERLRLEHVGELVLHVSDVAQRHVPDDALPDGTEDDDGDDEQPIARRCPRGGWSRRGERVHYAAGQLQGGRRDARRVMLVAMPRAPWSARRVSCALAQLGLLAADACHDPATQASRLAAVRQAAPTKIVQLLGDEDRATVPSLSVASQTLTRHGIAGADHRACADGGATCCDDDVTGFGFDETVGGRPYAPYVLPALGEWDPASATATVYGLMSTFNPYSPVLMRTQLRAVAAD